MGRFGKFGLDLWQLDPSLIGVLNLRNLPLLGLLVWLAVQLGRRPPDLAGGSQLSGCGRPERHCVGSAPARES